MSLYDSTVVGAALKERGIRERDRDHAVIWWLMSKPGETMLLVGAQLPYLRIDHDGNVTEEDPVHSGYVTLKSWIEGDPDTEGLT